MKKKDEDFWTLNGSCDALEARRDLAQDEVSSHSPQSTS